MVLDPGAARFARVLCVHNRKLLHRLGTPWAPLGRVDISTDVPGHSWTLDAVGASLGHSPWGGPWGLSLSVPAELPACLFLGFFPLGKLPYGPA